MNPSPRKKRTNPLAQWLRQASVDQRERAAVIAGTSVNYLFQIAGERREPKVSLALKIVQGIEDVNAAGFFEKPLPSVSAKDIADIYALEGL